MTFTDDQVRIEAQQHSARHWQGCFYYVGDQELFYERTFVRSRPPGRSLPPTPAESHWLSGGYNLGEFTCQWFGGLGSFEEVNELARKYDGVAETEHYPKDPDNPNYFLAFDDTDKALAFCRTEDFDALCLTLAKLP